MRGEIKLAISVVTMAAVAAVLVACGEDPVSTARTDNPNVAVSKMFEHEGCKVYRFKDAGEYVYYTNCPGSVQSARVESCGKNCTNRVPVTVQTSRSQP